MAHPIQKGDFLNDKIQFFSEYSQQSPLATKLGHIKNRNERNGYRYILANHQNLETEFAHLFKALQQQKDENLEVFWLYCYYCASMLESFHKAYSQSEKAADFKRIRDQIKERLEKINKKETHKDEVFINHLKIKFQENIKSLANAPFHIAKIRDYVVYANLCRVYWTFCRLTMVSGLNASRELIRQLDILLGTQTNVDQIIATIQAPTGVLYYFSVGLFLARFVVDAAMLVKHTFFPSKADLASESEEKTTRMERFKHELYKRHCNFANDLVWATVNFLSNFNRVVGISDPTAGFLTAAFLVFDVCLLIYKRELGKAEYLDKKAQYELEKKYYGEDKSISDAQRLLQLQIIDRQLKELEINWKTKEASIYFNIGAAGMLAAGFAAYLVVSNPVLIVGCFFLGTIGVAMYLTGDTYSTFKNKSLYLEQAQLTDDNVKLALKEYETARNDFIFTMIKNAVIPTVLITTFAICWPAALVLTAMYVGYEFYHAYHQHQGGQAAKQMSLPAADPQETATTLAPTS